MIVAVLSPKLLDEVHLFCRLVREVFRRRATLIGRRRGRRRTFRGRLRGAAHSIRIRFVGGDKLTCCRGSDDDGFGPRGAEDEDRQGGEEGRAGGGGAGRVCGGSGRGTEEGVRSSGTDVLETG